MDTGYIVVQTINTLFYASILFLIASGLSLIYGIMRVLNLAHGAFYMLGAYLAYSAAMVWIGPSALGFVLGFVLAVAVLAVIGAVFERTLLRPLYSKPEELQLLFTFAVMLMLDDIVKMVWGPEYKSYTVIPGGSVEVGAYQVPLYTVYVIVIGFAAAAGLWWFFSKTVIGKQMRAAAFNSEVAEALGINTSILFIAAFAIGSALSGLAGAAAAPILTAYPGMGADALVLSFAVLVIGGMGSIAGSLVGALIASVARTIMVIVYPMLEVALIYLITAVMLLIKPSGLFGKEIERR
ncbi:branched-chain amino acid ABC transporter permease [Pyrofollis japonicus]|uniref:branched-chain amino acid ABC transporter permease n=1 Tax=Pyrofollis japonicus TaxID=3060460 RepID=UPI00295A8B8F|nr:branched-chain amino acid ABC transporter permease [Pyrofollis japonicus]BEP17302.1 branched-chain amino acid ABC transporter permease [Pyrofollis japonicus]